LEHSVFSLIQAQCPCWIFLRLKEPRGRGLGRSQGESLTTIRRKISIVSPSTAFLNFVGRWAFLVICASRKIWEVSQKWWHTPILPSLERQRQEDHELEASLSYTERSCLKTTITIITI
jgi:hypothetical protein